MSTVIGIAFGNTTTSIATATDGKVDVIANPDGDRSIPSVLAYISNDEYHGSQALAHLIKNPSDTIINFRDFIGLPFDKINKNNSGDCCQVEEKDGKIGYSINEEFITIDEITKRHLKQIKLAAEDFIGKDIDGVVITVPTNFSTEQKNKLTEISNSAGLKVLQLINEPSAALLAHLATNETLSEDKTYVVADFGGIRSDAAVISVKGGILTILSTLHDFELGGHQLDLELSEFFAKEFQKKYGTNPRSNKKSKAKLLSESIVTKKTLSNVNTSTISVDSLADGFDFHSTVNRMRYELVARSVLTKMTQFVEKVVTKAGLENLDIDEVLLVGGTSHTPKLATNIQYIFPKSKIVSSSIDSSSINPSELNCRGAAFQASMVESFDSEEIKESLQPVITNTQHLSNPIGLVGADGSFLTILAAETSYPIRKSIFVEATGSALIQLVEGVRTIKETVITPEVASDDSEDDYSDEEPEVEKTLVYVPGTKLVSLGLENAKGKVEVVININKDGVLDVYGRVNGSTVKGSVEFA